MPEKRQRLDFIDIARGIAIICIVIGHVKCNSINRVVFPFNVPLFFLISGYFTSAKTDMRTFVKRKAQTLLVPYYVTCLVIILIGTAEGFILGGAGGALKELVDWIYGTLYGSGFGFDKPFYIKSIGAIWFLWGSFWGSVLLKLSLKMKEEVRLLFIAILFIFAVMTKQLVWLPLSLQPGCCAVFYMYVGYSFKELQPRLGGVRKEYKSAVLLFSLAVYLFFIKDYTGFELVHLSLGRGIVDIFGSLCACVVVFWISKKISPQRFLGKCLSYLGKYSLFVLCFHIIEQNLFPWWKIAAWLCGKGMPEFTTIPVLIVGKLTMDITAAVIASKIKPVRRLFGMKE